VVAPLLASHMGCLGCGAQAPSDIAGDLTERYPKVAPIALGERAPAGFVATARGFEPAGGVAAEALRGLTAAFPTDGQVATRFSSLDGFTFEVREKGAEGRGRLVGPTRGALFYPRKGGASLWSLTGEGLEEWLHVTLPEGRVLEWEVRGAAVRVVDSAVEVADADGIARVRVTAAEAFAPGGAKVPTRLAVSGNLIVLHVEGDAPEVLVDPLWQPTGRPLSLRRGHSATLLPSSKVLIAGGYLATTGAAFASCELYDPGAGAWRATGSLSIARRDHAVLLLKDGRVLVSGGRVGSGASASAEVYDPLAGTWSKVTDMPTPREGHTLTLLRTGLVLVAGGGNATSDEYDPATDKWTYPENIGGPALSVHAAVLMQDGKVLVAGGSNTDNQTRLYDPINHFWSPTGATLTTLRQFASGTVLGDGRVLLLGGQFSSNSAEVYDPSKNKWSVAGGLSIARKGQSMTLLPNGRVLVVGGNNGSAPQAAAELFDPSLNVFSTGGAMLTARENHTATLLPSGKVLIAGGSQALAADELFDGTKDAWLAAPSSMTNHVKPTVTQLPDGNLLVAGGQGRTVETYHYRTHSFAPVGRMSVARTSHTATLLPSGGVLVTGGTDASGAALDTAEIFDFHSADFSAAASMAGKRAGHTSTLLANGSVLIAGGARPRPSCDGRAL
jgi:WD40 repeat protein